MLLDVAACCCAKFETGQTFQPTTPNISFVPWSPKRTQQCWIRLHSSSYIVGAVRAHYAWFTKTYALYPSHDELQAPTLLGVVASVCTAVPTQTQQLQTLLSQQCWELLHPFAHHCQHARSLKVPKFTFCGGRELKTTTFCFLPGTSIQSHRKQLLKNLPNFDKLNDMEKRDEVSETVRINF